MSGAASLTSVKSHRIAVLLTVAMFAIWGMAHRLYDFLQPEFSAALSLNAYQTNLAGWILSLGYPLMAVPAAMLTRNFGYKSGVMFGLGGFAVGMFLFYPAAEQHEYFFLLAASLAIGCGLATLEIAADPLIVRLGSAETAVRRLNLAQTLNGIGAVLGLYLGQQIIEGVRRHPAAELAHTLVAPFFVIGACVLFFAFLVDNVEFPPLARERVARDDSTIADFRKLFSRRMYLLGAVALAVCSITQVVMWGFTISYARTQAPGLAGTGVLLWAFYAFMFGRVAGTALMYFVDPSKVLALFAAGGAASAAAAAIAGGTAGVWCILAASFFLSVVFPTIFGSAIRDIGAQTKSGSAFLMLAAGTGALVLALTKFVVGPGGAQYVMILPALGFAAIAAYAAVVFRADKRAARR
ncbi:MAG TPA: MFS transporter [Rhizomicrobium sp.]|nr:MFS transporter [Rhizomicrobium sp.]